MKLAITQKEKKEKKEENVKKMSTDIDKMKMFTKILDVHQCIAYYKPA